MSLGYKEKELIKKLKKDFNVTYELNNDNYKSGYRLEITKGVTKKILMLSAALNIVSLLFVIIGLASVVFEPEPDFYAAAPNGQVYGPLEKMR